jgi:hypothetical protein
MIISEASVHMSVYFFMKARVKYFIYLPSDITSAWVVLSFKKKIRSEVSPLNLSEKTKMREKLQCLPM